MVAPNRKMATTVVRLDHPRFDHPRFDNQRASTINVLYQRCCRLENASLPPQHFLLARTKFQ